MAWRGSLSRSVMSTARASTIRTSPLSRLRPPPLAAPRLQPRRLSFANPREEWKRWVMRSNRGDQMAEQGRRIVLKANRRISMVGARDI